MKKQRSYLILALLCASAAHAAQYATPTLNQKVDSVMRVDGEMYETCKFHSELISARQAKVDNVKNEACKKVVSQFFDAVQKGWDACSISYDMNVRNFISDSMDKALKTQGLYCTPAQALLAPCPACDKSFIDIKRVTDTFTTIEVKESMGAYSQLLPQLIESAKQNSCQEFASHTEEYKSYISRLAGELSRSKVKAVRFTRENVQPQEIKTRVRLGEEKNLANFDQTFPAIPAGTDEVGSGPHLSSSGAQNNGSGSVAQSSNANANANASANSSHSTSSQARRPAQAQTGTTTAAQNSTPSSSSSSGQSTVSGSTSGTPSGASSSASSSASKPRAPLPEGLEVTGKLSDGRVGFAYTDPKDPKKNYVGYQVRDPKTNKLKTYAYVTSRANAEAVKKNPTLCDQYIKDARTGAPKANADTSALSRGNEIFSPKNSSKPSTDMVQAASDPTQPGADGASGAANTGNSGGNSATAHSNSNSNSGTGTGISANSNPNSRTDAGTSVSANSNPNSSPGTDTSTGAVAGSANGAIAGSDGNGSRNASSNSLGNSSGTPSGGPATQAAATSAETGSSDAQSDSQYHIGSGVPAATGLKQNARNGLNPDAQVGLKTGKTRVSPSAASSREASRSSTENQAEAQKVRQQNLSISSPTDSGTGSGTGLKDHPNVGLENGSSGTGIKSQIKPAPDADKDHDDVSASTAQSDAAHSDALKNGDALKIGKPGSSTTGSSTNSSNTSGTDSTATAQSGSQSASHSKPKPAAKKRRPKAPSTQKSQPKPTEAQKQRVSEYTTLAATSKGFGTVRYFLLNKFPNPEIGRWEIVNGKTEEIKYNMPADSSVIKDLSAHPEKLESTFNSAKAKFKEVKPHFLNPDVTESLNQLWLK